MGERGFGWRKENARFFQTFFFEIKGKYEQVPKLDSETPIRF
jgi:hypothetical protein